MDKLLNPDVGLIIWTVVTFLCVVAFLGKFAWKPILAALEAREGKIKDDLRSAEESRRDAEKSRLDLEAKITDLQSRTQSLLDQAGKDGQKIREDLLKVAREESSRLAEKTRRELSEEQRRLVAELRGDVASLAVGAAEKILGKSVDKTVQEKALRDAASDLDAWSKAKN